MTPKMKRDFEIVQQVCSEISMDWSNKLAIEYFTKRVGEIKAKDAGNKSRALLDRLKGCRVGAMVTGCNEFDWGFIVTYQGTEAQLLKHKLIPERLFRTMPKSNVKAGRDENGSRCKLKRRAKGLYILEKQHRKEHNRTGYGRAGSILNVDIGPVWAQLGVTAPILHG